MILDVIPSNLIQRPGGLGETANNYASHSLNSYLEKNLDNGNKHNSKHNSVTDLHVILIVLVHHIIKLNVHLIFFMISNDNAIHIS